MDRSIVVVLIIYCLASCVTYDSPVLYHKDYEVGFNSKLRLDGYYLFNNNPTINDTTKEIKSFSNSPIFLYSDGRVKIWPSGNQTEVDSLLACDFDRGRVGNYQLAGDTLKIEYWFRDSGTILDMKRKILYFLVQQGKILQIGYSGRSHNHLDLNERYHSEYIFIPNSLKPDSSSNWVREKKKWNK